MAEERISPTEETINQCVEDLKEKKSVHHAEAAAAWKAVELKKEVEQYKTCCLVKSREIMDLYINLDLCYVAQGHRKTVLIKSEIQKLCEKEKSMEQKLKDAVKGIKEVKMKLNDVVDEACKLDRCVKEEKRCKQGLHEYFSNKGNGEWKDLISHIEEHAVTCFNKACWAFDAGVDVIGIQTFVDMDSLKTMAADLEVKMTAVQSDVKSVATKAEEEWKKSLQELLEIKGELVTGKIEKCRAVNSREGIEDTIDFLCSPEACDNFELTLEEICRKVKDNFGEGTDDNEDDHGKDHGKDRGKGKPTRQKSGKDSEEENWDID